MRDDDYEHGGVGQCSLRRLFRMTSITWILVTCRCNVYLCRLALSLINDQFLLSFDPDFHVVSSRFRPIIQLGLVEVAIANLLLSVYHVDHRENKR